MTINNILIIIAATVACIIALCMIIRYIKGKNVVKIESKPREVFYTHTFKGNIKLEVYQIDAIDAAILIMAKSLKDTCVVLTGLVKVNGKHLSINEFISLDYEVFNCVSECFLQMGTKVSVN
jgi:hypothetical protein